MRLEFRHGFLLTKCVKTTFASVSESAGCVQTGGRPAVPSEPYKNQCHPDRSAAAIFPALHNASRRGAEVTPAAKRTAHATPAIRAEGIGGAAAEKNPSSARLLGSSFSYRDTHAPPQKAPQPGSPHSKKQTPLRQRHQGVRSLMFSGSTPAEPNWKASTPPRLVLGPAFSPKAREAPEPQTKPDTSKAPSDAATPHAAAASLFTQSFSFSYRDTRPPKNAPQPGSPHSKKQTPLRQRHQGARSLMSSGSTRRRTELKHQRLPMPVLTPPRQRSISANLRGIQNPKCAARPPGQSFGFYNLSDLSTVRHQANLHEAPA